MNSLITHTDFQSKTQKQINFFLDLILPRLCLSCKIKLSTIEQIVCSKCLSEFCIVESNELESEYEKNFSKDKLIDEFKAAFTFKEGSTIQNLIHSLKYEQKFLAGIFLGRLIAKIWFDEIIRWNADLIVPVPLHRLKKAERGYNQSDYIAKGLSKELNIPFKSHLIKRIRHTETQTHLNLIERKENVKNAFKVTRKNEIFGKRIIIVDDVVTTGSTISECALVLKEAGAEKIFALFAAMAHN